MPGTGSRSLDLITVRLRSKRDTLLPFAFFISLAIMVHFLPNLGVPLHSDTAWIFRLQSSDDAGIESDAPYWMREMGAYQSGPVDGALTLGVYFGRANLLNLIQYWLMAKLAGTNGDLLTLPLPAIDSILPKNWVSMKPGAVHR